MDPIDAVFVLGGGTNEYPFDQHQASLWFFANTPKGSQKQVIALEGGGLSIYMPDLSSLSNAGRR